MDYIALEEAPVPSARGDSGSEAGLCGAGQTGLSDAARAWLAGFPEKTRPKKLADAYPRIANRLAELSSRPHYYSRYLDQLLRDDRGGRRGFPRQVSLDIAALKIHFINECSGTHCDI